MKKTILVLAIVFCVGHLSAQTLSPTVLPMCGGYFTGGGNSLSWTMGEQVTITFYTANNILSQGFQQPEVDSIDPTAIITGTVAASLCAGNTLNVPFTEAGTFLNGNIFTAQLSDASGSFASPVTIGSVTGVVSGTIACTIPTGMNGTGYRVRVVGNNPAINGTNNGTNIPISLPSTAAVNIVASPASSICAGTSTTFTASPVNGGTNPVFQWKKNNINVGTNSATYTDTTLNGNDTITCTLTSDLACVSGSPAVSSAIVMTVTPVVTPSVSIASDNSGTVCPEILVTFTATPLNAGSSPSFQWKKNNVNVGTNSSTYSASGFSNNDTIRCVVTPSVTCTAQSAIPSNSIAVSVGSCTITVSASGGICAGSNENISFSSTPTIFNANNIFTAQLSDSAGNFTSPVAIGSLASAASGIIPIIIPYSTLPGNTYKIRVVSSNPVIMGTASSDFAIKTFSTGFTETMGNTSGGNTSIPAYESSNGFDNDSLTMTGTGSVRNNQASNNYPGASAQSNVSITNTPGTYFQIEGINTTGQINKQLGFGIYKDIPASTGSDLVVEVSSNGSSYTALSFSPLPTGTTGWYYRTATGSIPSASNLRIRFRQTGSSTQFRIDDVNYSASDTTGITASGVTSFCIPGSVTLTAPNSHSFVWSNGSTNRSITATSTGNYFCTLPSLSGCTLHSNSIAVTASSVAAAAVSIASSTASPICAGTKVIFTATPSNGGTSPVYQWKKNGVGVGTNTILYTDSLLANNDQITCQMVSNSICLSGGATVNSNAITMSVNSNITPGISIASNPPGAFCSGTNVIFTATPVNGGASPFYQWIKNGVNVGSNSPTYSNTALNLSDSVSCVMTSNASCIIGSATVPSNKRIMVVTQMESPSVSISVTPQPVICSGGALLFTATAPSHGAYEWKKNGVTVGINSSTYSAINFANGDQVICIIQAASGCSTSPTASSNTITVALTSSPAISSFSPVSGFTGSLVSIYGSGFLGTSVVRFNGVNTIFTVVNSSKIIATVPSGASTGKIAVTNPCGSVLSSSVFSIILTLNTKVFIEGFYVTGGQMQAVLYNNYPDVYPPTACDSITIELHDSLLAYDLVESVRTLLNTDGTTTATFSSIAMNYPYYVVIRSRNGLETWSNEAVLFNQSSLNFDFTSP